ncbi:f-box/wd repeat-containing protein pof1 [Anaeramoeba flamelloides]|uniref:F-box/wd repeat-containing protein pof1 n=1 Tax=Anaeramoeba flamelloides TaxID=1746091 RepID=A0AAV7Z4N3_9EUKA|nr:f-box/wd repeat-containing protein pof1 [Anaeramoeba flamelloides]
MGSTSSKETIRSLSDESIVQLPEELLFYIFRYLDASSLMKVGSTNTYLDQIANDPLIWKKLFFRRFPHLSSIPVPPPTLKTWKKYYHHRVKWSSQWYKKRAQVTTQIKYRKGVNKASFTTLNEFATCNWDRTIKLWSLSNMKYTVLPTKPIGSVWSIRVSNDYSKLVSSSDNHEIHVYDLPRLRQSDELGVKQQEHKKKYSKKKNTNEKKSVLVQQKLFRQNSQEDKKSGILQKIKKTKKTHELLKSESTIQIDENCFTNNEEDEDEDDEEEEEEKEKEKESEKKNEKNNDDEVIEATVLTGHTAPITCLKFDNETVVSGSSDSTVRVWDQNTRECKSVIEHTDSIWALDYLDDYLVTGSKDTAVRWWSLPREEMLDLLVGHTAPVSCIEYRDSLIVSGSYDSAVKIWDLRSFDRCAATLNGHRGPISCLQLVDDSILTGSYDSSIKIWDRRKLNHEVHSFNEGDNCWILSLQYKDGRLLTSSNLGEVKIIDFRTKEMLEVEENELLARWSSGDEETLK